VTTTAARESDRKWKEAHRNERREYNRKWREAHREHLREYDRRRRVTEQRLEWKHQYDRKWRKTHQSVRTAGDRWYLVQGLPADIKEVLSTLKELRKAIGARRGKRT
jgi:FMN phosphatase YigB (HAD superfamily)